MNQENDNMKKFVYFAVIISILVLLGGCGKDKPFGSYKVIDDGKVTYKLNFKDKSKVEIQDYVNRENLYVDYEIIKGKDNKYIVFDHFQIKKRGASRSGVYVGAKHTQFVYIMKKDGNDFKLYIPYETIIEKKEDIAKATITPKSEPLILKNED